MTIYRYALRMRPLQMGAQPKGFIMRDGATWNIANYDNDPARYGTLDYPTQLSDADVSGYELQFMGEFERSDRYTEYWQDTQAA